MFERKFIALGKLDEGGAWWTLMCPWGPCTGDPQEAECCGCRGTRGVELENRGLVLGVKSESYTGHR